MAPEVVGCLRQPACLVQLGSQPGVLRLGLELEVQLDGGNRVVLRDVDHDVVAIG
jgi:hypothetical protein